MGTHCNDMMTTKTKAAISWKPPRFSLVVSDLGALSVAMVLRILAQPTRPNQGEVPRLASTHFARLFAYYKQAVRLVEILRARNNINLTVVMCLNVVVLLFVTMCNHIVPTGHNFQWKRGSLTACPKTQNVSCCELSGVLNRRRTNRRIRCGLLGCMCKYAAHETASQLLG